MTEEHDISIRVTTFVYRLLYAEVQKMEIEHTETTSSGGSVQRSAA